MTERPKPPIFYKQSMRRRRGKVEKKEGKGCLYILIFFSTVPFIFGFFYMLYDAGWFDNAGTWLTSILLLGALLFIFILFGESNDTGYGN